MIYKILLVLLLSANTAFAAQGSFRSEGGSGGASAFDDLSDVTITSPADNTCLTYDTGSGQWIDETCPGGATTELPASIDTDALLLFNVKDPAYGAVGDGVTDDAAAIELADTAANAANGCVYFPGGVYEIRTGITADADCWIAEGAIGDLTVEISADATLTSGWMFTIDNQDGWLMRNITFDCNSTGVNGFHTLNGSSRYEADNVRARLCADGIALDGWIGRGTLWANDNSGTGISFSNANGTRIYVVSETNAVGVYSTDSADLYLEGEIEANTTGGWRVGSGSYSSNIHFESNGDYALDIGVDANATQVFTAQGGTTASVEGEIRLNNCQYVNLLAMRNRGQIRDESNEACTYVGSITQNTNNSDLVQHYHAFKTADDSPRQSFAVQNKINYISDPYFERDISAWASSGVAVTKETSIEHWFPGAMRITKTGGSTTVGATLELGDFIAEKWRGQRIVASAWIYVPSGQQFVAEGGAGPITSLSPNATIATVDTFATSQAQDLLLDRWNFVVQELDIPEAGTLEDAAVTVWLSRGTTGAQVDVTDYIVVSGLYVGPLVSTPDSGFLMSGEWDYSPVAFPDLDGVIHASDYGVVCDGSTTITSELQNAVNALQDSIASNEGQCVQLPVGVCVIDDPIILTSTTDTDTFNNACIRGVGLATATDIRATVIDHTAVTDGPAFEITAGRGVLVEKISFHGPNTDPVALSEPSYTAADYVTGSVRTNALSPQATICIDCLAGDPAGTSNDYPGLTHRATVSGSFRVQLRDLNIENTLIGVAVSPNGESNQADDVELYNVHIEGAQYCTSWGQNQNRSTSVLGGSCQDFYVGHTGVTHGDQIGGMPTIQGHQFINGVALFTFADTTENAGAFRDNDAEGFRMLGRIGSGTSNLKNPFTIDGGRFSAGKAGWTELPPPHFLEVHAPFIWRGSFFKYAGDDLMATSVSQSYEYALNILTTVGQSKIENVSFSGGVGESDQNYPLIARQRDLNEGRVAIVNSWFEPVTGSGRFLSDDYYNNATIADRIPLNLQSALFRNAGDLYGVKLSDSAEYEAITMDASSWNVNTTNKDLEFSVDTSGGDEPGVLQVGDILNFRFDSVLGGASAFDHPGCRIVSITFDAGNTENDVVCEMLWKETFYTSSYAPSSVKVQRKFWAVEPGVTLECDLNTSTSLTGCTNESILEVGDWLNPDISGVSSNTRITVIGSGTATLNKATTATTANVDLYDSELVNLTP